MSAHPAGPRHEVRAPSSVPVPPSDLSALVPSVWPVNVSRSGGVLSVAGRDVVSLAREHATPLLVLDEDDLRDRARRYVSAFGEGNVFYAAKAFLCAGLVRWLEEDGLGLDVSTGGELALALGSGFPPDRLVFHGNNKSVPELTSALEAGVGRFVLDSLVELDRLAALAAERALRPRVLVRVTVGVEAHTHEFVATAHEDQKFGFSLAGGDALAAARRVLASESLDLVGFHSHIGSQIFDAAGFELAAHRVVGLLAQLRDECGVVLPELDLGGGLGIAYVEGDDPLDVDGFARDLRGVVERECALLSLPLPRLLVEPGRAVVGPSTFTLYEVGTVKPVRTGTGDLTRLYVSVDGGMSDNLRTALYDAVYGVVLASRVSSAPPALVRVVGKHCESGDVVVRDAHLPADVAPGDLLAVPASGAYHRSMASNYNLVPRPPVVSVRDGLVSTLVRRETLADLFRLDPGWSPRP